MQGLKQPFNVLLLGKTSYDKSTTGNTILQRDVFSTTPMGAVSHPSTQDGQLFGSPIKITDTPGIMEHYDKRKTIKVIKQFLQSWTFGYDAIVIVMRYPVRMTPEEESNITIMREIVGNDALKKFGIIVFTNGVCFNKRGHPTFDEYLESEVRSYSQQPNQNESKEYLGRLILDVQRRCLAYDNDTEDDVKMNQQNDNFLQEIIQLRKRNNYVRFIKHSYFNKKVMAVVAISVAILITVVVLCTVL